ncbi:DUF1214 domain-containing protein [Rhizobium sp. C4]|uniref:DUF1214 domain-containing protein n=1 Tax=Rhizobium sp. C4 TaxID=1349800 RepID=UPI001E4AF6FF|nr:DUF1214 domain-containing protein [Rhizobium sp. C4]MCD2175545.1 DUF1214 domain-containing protein [Rhizobium sp. C4]
MFRVPFLVAVALMIAFGVGILITKSAISRSSGFSALTLGSWQAYPKAQTSEADPYARNHRAKASGLLLGSAEGLVFYADNDDAGEALTGGCTYRLSGKVPQARFWTLTVTDPANNPLTSRPGLPSALNAQSVLYGNDGTLTVSVSQNPQPGNWLSVPPIGHYRLAFTLFDTPVAGSSGLIDQSMPLIVREGCGDA